MPDITMHSSYWSIEPSSGQMFCSSKHCLHAITWILSVSCKCNGSHLASQ